MVVGVFSRGSRTNIRPIELGRRLVREMDDQRSVDVQGRRVTGASLGGSRGGGRDDRNQPEGFLNDPGDPVGQG